MTFDVEPHRVIFIDLQREKDVLWAMEEALKCEGLAAVIAEVREISFSQSRRLQLAVESSRVTGFLLRNDARKLSTTTCVARWQVTPLPSELEDELPGVGFPRWQVDLLRVRNGSTGSWKLEWVDGRFVQVDEKIDINELPETKGRLSKQKRFVSIWFRHLTTDWLTLRRPELREVPFVFAAPIRGRIVITAASDLAENQGIAAVMAAADAKAIVPALEVVDDIPGQADKLLKALGEWCIRYTPMIAIDLPDGLILDISGCAHLWGGERAYLKAIIKTLRNKGYDARGAMADTVGASRAIARFGKVKPIIEPGGQANALLSLPPAALRLEPLILERLQKLGFYTIKSFIGIGRSVLRRRFGDDFLLRLNQALGNEDEPLQLLHPVEPYHERLPCLEPIRTATGIEIAIKTLLEQLCRRLQGEGKGLRIAVLKCYRVDGKVIGANIGTNRASHHTGHLFKLFELKISSLEPALGIELFTLDAPKVEDVSPEQEALWSADGCGLEDGDFSRIARQACQ